MTDLAAAGATQWPGLADAERREVVVVHEAMILFLFERTDQLLIARRAEGEGREHLGLTAGEQRGAVGAREEAGLHVDRPNVLRAAAVRAALVLDDDLAHQALLDAVHDLFDLRAGVGDALEPRRDLLGDTREVLLPALLVGRLDRLADLLGPGLDGIADLVGRLPERVVSLGLAGLLAQLLDGAADADAGLLGHADALEDDLLGHLVAAKLDLQHTHLAGGHGQVHAGGHALLEGRVEDQFVLEPRNLGGGEGTLERGRGEVQRGGCADD